MELDDFQTLRLVEERVILKVHSFRTWEEFIVWANEMGVKFKAFIRECLDDVVADGDAKNADLLEIKKKIK